MTRRNSCASTRSLRSGSPPPGSERASRADGVVQELARARVQLEGPDLALRLAPFTLSEETYGFVIKPDSPLRTPMDVSILKLQRQGKVAAIANRLLDST